MSIRALNWAWSIEDVTPTEKFVLICLADHHNGRTGLCCPSNERIEQRTRFKPTAVKDALASLARKGLISSYPGSGKGRGRRLFVLAIIDAPTETKPLSDREKPSNGPANIEPESKPEKETRKRDFSKWDSGKGEGARRPAWGKPEPKQSSYFLDVAKHRIEETKRLITETDRPSPEERARIVEQAMRGFRVPA